LLFVSVIICQFFSEDHLGDDQDYVDYDHMCRFVGGWGPLFPLSISPSLPVPFFSTFPLSSVFYSIYASSFSSALLKSADLARVTTIAAFSQIGKNVLNTDIGRRNVLRQTLEIHITNFFTLAKLYWPTRVDTTALKSGWESTPVG